jgi:hypothetical protein
MTSNNDNNNTRKGGGAGGCRRMHAVFLKELSFSVM